ncbi:MAG: carboxypeptidase-like regulatory domain-containing protein [Blastocatellia bacterium]
MRAKANYKPDAGASLKRPLVYRVVIRPLTLSIFLFVTSLSALAQEGTSTLRGTVADTSGAVVPGATVSIANQATGLNRRSVATDSSGDYVFTSLVPGVYRLTIEATGFKRATQENLTLAVGETRELKLTLEAGGANETVNVNSGRSSF